MSLPAALNQFLRRWTRRAASPSPRRKRRPRLSLEVLEGRCLPATITVTSRDDNSTADGQVTLREAIQAANTNLSVDGSIAGTPGADTIVFQAGLTDSMHPILLSLGQFIIYEPLTIQGLGAANTIIDAQQHSRIFDITASAGDVTLNGLTVTGGRTTAAADGGGDAGGGAIRFQSSGTLALRDGIVADNASQDERGGGIYAVGPVTLTGCTVAGNSTQGDSTDGGGLFARGNVTLANSTIAGNSTQGNGSDGGGLEADGNLTVTNSTIAGNSILGQASNGSGLECFGILTLNNSTVAGNSAPAAGVAGMDSKREGAVLLRSSLVAGNSTGGSTQDLNLTGTLTVSHSLIGSNTGTSLVPTGLTPDANGNLIGSAASPIDPRLGPLQDHGGPTQTLALLPSSPAIDRGSNPLELATDQRGGAFVRRAGAAVDMGAFEVQDDKPPPPPQALDDHVTILENSGPAPLNVLVNDSGSGLRVTGITQPLRGQALILPGGIGVSYLPNRNSDFPDAFTYTVSDSSGQTATATVFVNVSGANNPPQAQDDVATVLDTGVSGSGQTPLNVLANDSGNHLMIVAVTQGAHGSVLVDLVLGQGLAYQADEGFSGTDPFTYTVRDDAGRTATATVTVTVVDTGVPTAHDDAFTVPAHLPSSNNSGTSVDVLANDTGRHLLVTAVTRPAHGSVQLMPGSPLVYLPDDNYAGPDAFTYTVTDDKGQMATASVSLTVVLVDNTTLHVQDQTATVQENGALIGINPLEIDLLAHDTGTPPLLVTGVTQPAHGTVQRPIPDSPTAGYAPDPDFASTDTFTYTVMAGNGQTATANVVVTVVGSAAPLAAHDDTVVVPAGSAVIPIDVLGNDTGSGVHVTAVTQGANGTAAILPFGIGVTYQPNAGFVGTDQFTYTVTDSNGQTATATVTVRMVTSLAPTARVTGPATGLTGQSLPFTLGASSVTGDPAAGFTYLVDWGDHSPPLIIPARAGNGAGVVVSRVYAAAGSYTVRVTATDQDGITSPVATTSVAITMPTPPPAGNAPPVLHNVLARLVKGSRTEVLLTGRASDPDRGDRLTLRVDWGEGRANTYPLGRGPTRFSTTHHYRRPGFYTITLTLLDSQGAMATASMPFVVDDACEPNNTLNQYLAHPMCSLSAAPHFTLTHLVLADPDWYSFTTPRRGGTFQYLIQAIPENGGPIPLVDLYTPSRFYWKTGVGSVSLATSASNTTYYVRVHGAPTMYTADVIDTAT